MDSIDEIIRNAQNKGEFSNLPGQGKPLKLDDDPHTPPHLRMAHKLLKDNDLVPDWISQGHVLDQKHEDLLKRVRGATRAFRGAINDADRSSQPAHNRQQAESAWERAKEALRAEAKQHNREVLSYNLKVPKGVMHKPTFDVDREMAKLYLP
jgi:hypothetical protein